MKKTWTDRLGVLAAGAKSLALVVLTAGAPQAGAHISYSGRNFGAFNADGSDPATFIASNSVTSDYGWASGIDTSLGDSHKLLPYRFALAEPGFVTIRAEGSAYSYTWELRLPGGRTRVVTNAIAGLERPAFSLCAGLAHPSGTDHDKSPSSLTYLDIVCPETMTDGCFDALGNWCIGRDTATDLSDLTRFRYVGNAYDGAAAPLEPFVRQEGVSMDESGAVYRFTNDLIHGDDAQDGIVTATYFLAPGDYSLFVGGGNYHGPDNAGGNTNGIFGVKVTMAVDPPMRSPGIPGYKVGWGLASRLSDSSWSDTNALIPPRWTQIAVRDSSAVGTDTAGTLYWDSANPAGMRWLSFPAVRTCVGNGFLAALETNGTIHVRTGNSPEITPVSDPLHPFLWVEAARDYIVVRKYDETVAVRQGGGAAPTNIPANLTNVVGIAGGDGHVIALKRDGTVESWGAGTGGQLIVPSDLSGVVQVTAGDGFSAALKSDGSVIAWGALTVTIPSGTNPVVQIAAGSAHLAALFSDGTVKCWGDNSAGQCTPPKGLQRVFQIACGGRSTMALTSQLKIGEEEASPSPTPSPAEASSSGSGVGSSQISGESQSGEEETSPTPSSSPKEVSSSGSGVDSSRTPANSKSEGKQQGSVSPLNLTQLQPSVIVKPSSSFPATGLSGITAESMLPARQVTQQEEDARPACACCGEVTAANAVSEPRTTYSNIPRYPVAIPPEIPEAKSPAAKLIPRPVDPKKKTRTLYKLSISRESGDASSRSGETISGNQANGYVGDPVSAPAGRGPFPEPSPDGNLRTDSGLTRFRTFVRSLCVAIMGFLSRLAGG